MTTFYVWTGTLKGVPVQASTPRQAVISAVADALRGGADVVLTGKIRVTRSKRKGADPHDVWFDAPYETSLPEVCAFPHEKVKVRSGH